MKRVGRLAPPPKAGEGRVGGVCLAGAAIAAGLLIAAGAAGVLCARSPAPRERVIAAYTTSLAHRSPGQVENALRAAHALDGAVVPSGGVFSFNRRVGPWTADRGYRRAPVSYDGEIMLAVGGGVCQVSTTAYGAALLGGMEVLERHRHWWPVSYARPGLDASVAFPSIDLRFRNPLPAAVRVRARRSGERLIVELLSTASTGRCSIETERIAIHPPATVVRREEDLSPGQVLRANRGQAGQEVAVYRVRRTAAGPERTLISVDAYPTLNRIVKIGGSAE
jgi:vancomycin resistance protein YoaR